ncbi:hypothetical protein NP493_1251g00022 [Ridgeia piscesae]|uniref:Sushi, von Willebrand factor type A, EGF and pentraxin domain-containing protein 1-like n=1 Tax=Ridgeia piscesae TaxID=27915 RepID=A0AAD9KAN9_RIDPI|nr:hypothetical protein NP493_1251g00022 [Ridgeia piscesae]
MQEVVPEGCSFDTLSLDGLVERCFDHLDNKTQHIEKELAPVGTNCVIKYDIYLPICYEFLCSGGYWNGPVLKCVGKHDANREIKRRQKKSFWWNRSSRPAPVRCSRPADPAHGAVQGTGDTYGDGHVVKYECYTGYRVTAGSRERTCRRNGWTGDSTCTRVSCGYLSDPTHGDVSMSGHRYGDSASYSCYSGYTLSGRSRRTCTSHGSWSGSTPSCTRVTCRRLSDPAHGDVRTSGHEYGDYATYSCDTGYTMTGYYRRTCDSSGVWRRNAPSCARISCGRQSAPTHGYVSGYSYRYGDVTRYSCRPDYTLTGGSSTRTCTASGRWTGSKPSCVFSNTCGSHPCQNGAKCVNGLNRYNCQCAYGWFGTNCEIDILAPRLTHCPSNKTHYISTPSVTLNWTAPTFSDPTIRLTSNYPLNKATFPWGEFFIQYVATKPSNGLRTQCLFREAVYPRPCQSFVAPDNGAVACNGWNGRFGEVCTVLCQQNWDLPPGKPISRLYVCGASGQWIPKMNISACSERWYGVDRSKSGEPQPHYFSGDCADQRKEIGEKYIEVLTASDMAEMCTSSRWRGSCVPQKAKVVCGKNTLA